MRPWHTRFALVFSALLLLSWNASALVETSGAVTGTWSPENNPYHVTDDILVSEDSYLEIAPGVEIYFAPATQMVIRGQLTVLGEAKDRVIFDALDPDQPWRGIVIASGTSVQHRISGATLENCQEGVRVDGCNAEILGSSIQAGKRALGLYNSAQVRLDKSQLTVTGPGAEIRVIDGARSELLLAESDLELNVTSSPASIPVSAVRLSEVVGQINEMSLTFNSESAAYGMNLVNCGGLVVDRSTIRMRAAGSAQGLRPVAIRASSSTIELRHLSIDMDASGWPSAAIHAADRARVTMINSIIANPTGRVIQDTWPVDIDQLSDLATVRVSYSCFYNLSGFEPFGSDFDRPSMIHDDPLWENFETGNYQLQPGSPCIDAGSLSLGPDPDGTAPDIGRYYFFALDRGEVPFQLPEVFELGRAWPNPFNAGTRFDVTLPDAGVLKVEVFDVLGRLTARIAQGNFAGGQHRFIWNGGSEQGNVASGVYLLRVEHEGKVRTERLVLLR